MGSRVLVSAARSPWDCQVTSLDVMVEPEAEDWRCADIRPDPHDTHVLRCELELVLVGAQESEDVRPGSQHSVLSSTLSPRGG